MPLPFAQQAGPGHGIRGHFPGGEGTRGFSLHAGVAAAHHEQRNLERLCR